MKIFRPVNTIYWNTQLTGIFLKDWNKEQRSTETPGIRRVDIR